MGQVNLTMLLAILVVLLLVTIITSYCIAGGLGHVPWIFPYISETGTYEPESCIFGFGMNVSAFLYMVAVYLRYRELLEFRALSPASRISRKANFSSLVLGLLSASGLCLVANFQVKRVPLPHYIGAFLCFVGGTVYFGFQALFSRRMCPHVSTMRMAFLRLTLTAFSGIAFVVCVVSAVIAATQFDGKNQVDWLPENKGYAMHIVSTSTEWLVALLFVASLVTYIPEMKNVTLSPPKFRIVLLESVSATVEVEKY